MPTPSPKAPRRARPVVLALLLTAIAAATGGCALLVPHDSCLRYDGEVRNAHGYGEVARPTDYRAARRAAYDFDPLMTVTPATGDDSMLDLMIADPLRRGELTRAGLTLFIRCPRPTWRAATLASRDGGFTAFLVRDDEYLGAEARRNQYGKKIPPPASDATGPFDPARPLPPGVYVLAGTIRVISHEKFPVALLEMNLETTRPVMPNGSWLARNADAPRDEKDVAMWRGLPTGPAVGRPTPAQVRGRFRVVRCMRLL